MEDEELREGLQAYSVVPIHDNNRVIGCLNVASHTPEEIPESCRPVLETIAAQMGSTTGSNHKEIWLSLMRDPSSASTRISGNFLIEAFDDVGGTQ